MGGRRLSGVARGREEKRRIANGEWRIGMVVERFIDQFVSGPEGVAGCHDFGGVLLSIDAPVSPRRVVRIDIADQASSRIGPSQYRGRTRARKYRQLCAAPPHFAGFVEGTRNASDFGRTGRDLAGAGVASGARSMREPRQDGSRLNKVVAGQIDEMKLFAIRYSPFAKARSAR
jgi:hypothetical protein